MSLPATPSPVPARDIFVPLIGQYENIGDVILRRPLLGWLRPLGRLHIYVGRAPADYTRALEVEADDRVYESFARWYLAGMVAALSARASYCFKPGEIQLTLAGMKEHVALLPLLALVRLRRGTVLRLGSGARNFARLPRALMGPSLALAQLTRWRDGRTASFLGHGGTMPDLAFGDGDAAAPAADRSQRKLMIVSMRGDRPPVSPAWVDGVRASAAARGLELWVVTQVARDAPRSAELAKALGANLLNWDGSGHLEQEARLRQLYRRAELAVSDRLHVLIAAYTHGVVPVGLLMDGSDKIARHFDAAGVHGVAVHAAGLDSAAIVAAIAGIAERAEPLLAALPAARQALDAVRQQASALVAGEAGHAPLMGSRPA